MNAEFLALAQMAVGGGLMGMAYALVAYGFQLTYAAGKAVNFGQGELVMLGAFTGLFLIGIGLPYWAAVPVAMVAGAALGWFVDQLYVIEGSLGVAVKVTLPPFPQRLGTEAVKLIGVTFTVT